jgi:hypothetical protein
MQTLPGGWVGAVEAYATEKFRGRAHNTLDADFLQRECPHCKNIAVLVCDGFGDDGSIGLVCVSCGGYIDLLADGRLSAVHDGSGGKSWRNILRKGLAENGIDWKTGRGD